MKVYKKILSFLLLAALGLAISPKELLHELSHHQDTKDIICNASCNKHLSNRHQHCDVLQLTTPPLLVTSMQQQYVVLPAVISFYCFFASNYYLSCFSLSFL